MRARSAGAAAGLRVRAAESVAAGAAVPGAADVAVGGRSARRAAWSGFWFGAGTFGARHLVAVHQHPRLRRRADLAGAVRWCWRWCASWRPITRCWASCAARLLPASGALALAGRAAGAVAADRVVARLVPVGLSRGCRSAIRRPTPGCAGFAPVHRVSMASRRCCCWAAARCWRWCAARARGAMLAAGAAAAAVAARVRCSSASTGRTPAGPAGQRRGAAGRGAAGSEMAGRQRRADARALHAARTIRRSARA